MPGLVWSKEAINQSINQNIEKLTRWSNNASPRDAFTINNLNDDVTYLVGSGGNAVSTMTLDIATLSPNMGAKTIIIENADLYIKQSFNYNQNDNLGSQEEISSLGVIIKDGNLIIDPSVEEIAGAYFVSRSSENDLQFGNVISGTPSGPEDSEKQLTVYGSILGNIGPVLEKRTFAGDVQKDEGAITIRYDQRIIQNTPPGFSELFGNFEQSQIAR
ncbi:hypothetical protein GF376_02240 [Candidatus Peregrinibacteria bacterium]|nr:hypothetical protein [Candidatus Peregrinibacteria bacterium]